MAQLDEQVFLDFYTYPPIGGDDWRYTFQTAQIRAIEMKMLNKTALLDMANAQSFEQAANFLTTTEYALQQSSKNLPEMENTLKLRRKAVRELFADLMIDKPYVELFRTRDDFANLRLALRRTLTEKPLGTDYSSDGNVSAQIFEQVFTEENYQLLPDYMSQAVEQAVLAYYQNKDIRQIDYAIDAFQAQYNLKKAHRLESVFLLGLFRIQIDLTNIRTMLRLKFTPPLTGAGFTESEQRNVFLQGGFIELERLKKALDIGYEAQGQLFYVLPYHQLVETGAGYLASDKSFLKIEQQCQEYLSGYLKSTIQITAGPQPIIAYLLMKENEIRNIRLILTAKKNSLDTKLILDRIS
jgi:V/A-type H+-transporting ATPase subunit C